MKIITHKAVLRFLFFISGIMIAGTSSGQMLETVDLSPPGVNYHTYVTGINNLGYITGYYTNGSGNNVGFIINKDGYLLQIDNNDLGTNITGATVESINDHGVAVVVGTDGSTKYFFKCYIDIASGSIESFSPLSLSQPNAVPLDINNNNDVAGWYQSTQRWLFVKHDSIVPVGNAAWEASRYSTAGPTYYNTWSSGINDANTVAGYSIDGNNYTSFTYDNLTGTYNPLSSSFKIKLTDINNNGWVTGEHLQTNGTWMGFFAQAGNGVYTASYSLAGIFESDTIQSVATGLNDNGDIVGYYLHPATNKWTGFIYHNTTPAYHLPSFNYNQHTWGNIKNVGGTDPMSTFPPSYYQGFYYETSDPYANNGYPFLEPITAAIIGMPYVAAHRSPSWLAFATEVDHSGLGLQTHPDSINYYRAFAKPNWGTKWIQRSDALTFKGYCYGFVYSVLLRHIQDNTFSSMFGYPINTDISVIQQTDNNAIKAIERGQLKQFDPNIGINDNIENYPFTQLWEGLYRLKNTFREPFVTTNPRPMGIGFINPPGSHVVMPYHIVTPRKLPFDYPVIKYDTVYVYDGNHPNTPGTYFTINTSKYYMPHDSVYSNYYNNANLDILNFNMTGIRQSANITHSALKTTSQNGYDPIMHCSVLHNCDYLMQGAGNAEASLINSNYTINTTDFKPTDHIALQQTMTPRTHFMDTSYTVDIISSNYVDSNMLYLQTNKTRSMGISRITVPGETDHSSQKNAFISYGNPDNITKYINTFLVEMDETRLQGSNILAQQICAEQGDSIVSKSSQPYTLTIEKVSGTTNCLYDLTVLAAYDGHVASFSTQLELSGNSSHTIDPYYSGNENEITILVDNGMDGTIDNIHPITGWPVTIEGQISQNNIQVFPNPANDVLNITMATLDGTYHLSVTDVVGKLVTNQTVAGSAGKAALNIEQYTPGMYLIQVSDDKGNILLKGKFIKQ